MKKMYLLVLTLIMSVGLSGCKKTTYNAASEFYYSSDAGKTYGNRTKEFNVGETIYMQVIVKSVTNKKAEEKVSVTLTIPSINAVSATYYDGQPITPNQDLVNNLTFYTFYITASKNSGEWNFIFQFVPNKETDITMKLEFDSKIDSIYNKQNTIRFVKSE